MGSRTSLWWPDHASGRDLKDVCQKKYLKKIFFYICGLYCLNFWLDPDKPQSATAFHRPWNISSERDVSSNLRTYICINFFQGTSCSTECSMWKGKFLKNKYFKHKEVGTTKALRFSNILPFFDSWTALKAFPIFVPVVNPVLFVTHVKHCHYFDNVSCPYMPGDW